VNFKKLLILALIGGTLISCDFFSRKGCRDSQALNYDQDATKNDFSCIFRSDGIIYWQQNTQTTFETIGATSITIKIDDEEMFSNVLVSDYATASLSSPSNCTDTSWLYFENKIIYDDGANLKLEVFNQNDSLILRNLIGLNSGCNSNKIQF
jgi:hypothetical protein